MKKCFGTVSALACTTFNEDYTVVYTIYDQNHHGRIKICGYNREPQTIVTDENVSVLCTLSERIPAVLSRRLSSFKRK